MAQFTETRTPYEFLVRWDINGNIKGAHVGFLDTILKDSNVISQKPSNVESVSVGDAIGFPLTDILESIHIDALKENEALKMSVATLNSEKETLTASLQQSNIENQRLNAEIQRLILELNSLKEQLESKASNPAEKPDASSEPTEIISSEEHK